MISNSESCAGWLSERVQPHQLERQAQSVGGSDPEVKLTTCGLQRQSQRDPNARLDDLRGFPRDSSAHAQAQLDHAQDGSMESCQNNLIRLS